MSSGTPRGGLRASRAQQSEFNSAAGEGDDRGTRHTARRTWSYSSCVIVFWGVIPGQVVMHLMCDANASVTMISNSTKWIQPHCAQARQRRGDHARQVASILVGRVPLLVPVPKTAGRCARAALGAEEGGVLLPRSI